MRLGRLGSISLRVTEVSSHFTSPIIRLVIQAKSSQTRGGLCVVGSIPNLGLVVGQT